MILEEGLELETLEKVTQSIGKYSKMANVPVVTGDTKVMEKGAIDKMVIVTSAIGKRSPAHGPQSLGGVPSTARWTPAGLPTTICGKGTW